MKFKEHKTLNLSQIDEEILKFWKDNNIFGKSISEREGAPQFVFYEGPPSANGLPGIHHVMSRAIKDLFCRYKTLKGYQVKRKGGWDTHGLPVELQVEKKLGITKEDIGKKVSIEEYNIICREEVMKFKSAWGDLTERMGYWVDLEHPYITFENNYIETLWWILKNLFEKGLLYEGYTIQPYSPAAGTGLSSHELNLPGCYRPIKDTTIVAQFKVAEQSKDKIQKLIGENGDVYFLAWTTTPWTLPANSALAVGEKIIYVAVRTINPYTFKPEIVILAKDLFEKYFQDDIRLRNILIGHDVSEELTKVYNYFHEQQFQDLSTRDIEKFNIWLDSINKASHVGTRKPFGRVINEFKGKELLEINYEQLLDYIYVEKESAFYFRIIAGDFVSTEDGTGIVHIAPTFGADDFRVANSNHIVAILANGKPIVDTRGRFVNEITDFAGEYVREEYLTEEEKETEKKKQGGQKYLSVDERIGIKLKKENKAFKIEKYEHNYPHCWRTDKPILYYPLDSWFIKTTAAKERLIELNNTINWKPKSTGEGRFGNWLENLQDWNLSRSRFWGTPLPIWMDWVSRSVVVVGNKNELLRNKTFTPTNNEKKGNFYSDEISIGVIGYIEKAEFEGYYQNFLNGDKVVIDELGNEVYNDLTDSQGPEYADVNTSHYINVYLKASRVSFVRNLPLGIFHKYFDEIDSSKINSLDLHRPFVDKVCFIPESGLTPLGLRQRFIFLRVPDLVDVWFDSGAMPYAQWHYPFENKETFQKSFPANFIAEGVDQTRGWFFTLHVLAAMLFDSVAFKNVISNGLILDKFGNKMSKRVGNVVDPFKTIAENGADATRWYLLSNAQPWDNTKFDIAGIDEVKRKLFGTLFNTYCFFALYANIDGFTYKETEVPSQKLIELDHWIISLLNSLIKEVEAAYDDYEPTKAARAIETFVDEHLSNWYVRLSRRRFWKGEYSDDKIAAYQTLYKCLNVLSKLMAPIAPFFGDFLYKSLNDITSKEKSLSVHLSSFPKYEEVLINKELEERMQLAQDISSLVLSLRKKVNIKVRQPLNKILIPITNQNIENQIERVKDLILAEVNVKQIEYIKDTSGVVHKKVKPNFKSLGQKLGKKMKLVAPILAGLSQDEISELEKSEKITLAIENEPVELVLEDVEILSEDIPGWQVANKNELIVALDVTITSELRNEGNARELVNRIQKLRKDSGFEVTDRINVKIKKQDTINEAISDFKAYICAEILADTLEIEDNLAEGVEIEVNEMPVKIIINRKTN